MRINHWNSWILHETLLGPAHRWNFNGPVSLWTRHIYSLKPLLFRLFCPLSPLHRTDVNPFFLQIMARIFVSGALYLGMIMVFFFSFFYYTYCICWEIFDCYFFVFQDWWLALRAGSRIAPRKKCENASRSPSPCSRIHTWFFPITWMTSTMCAGIE